MYGRTVLSNNTIFPTRVSADGKPLYKAGGITIDWANVAAVSGSNATLPDGSIVLIGQKYLRYGQVMCKQVVAEIQTITLTGGPTAGSATISLPAVNDYAAQSFTVGFGASAATVQTAIQALSRIGANNATVGRTGAGSNGDPYIFTVTFNKELGNIPQLTLTSHTFTGGTTPTATLATSTDAGANAGMFGPYDPAASDGRQTLERGDCFILDETVLQYPAGSAMLSAANDQVGSAIEGGAVWIDRVLHSAAATHTLALGPTLAEVLTAFPGLQIVRD